LSSIRGYEPSIVTQRVLARPSDGTHSALDFVRRPFTGEELLRYFKGERLGTSYIFISSAQKQKSWSDRTFAQRISDIEGALRGSDPFWDRFGAFLNSGPGWAKEALTTTSNWIDTTVALVKQVAVAKAHSRTVRKRS
jgi:hypothetical protein